MICKETNIFCFRYTIANIVFVQTPIIIQKLKTANKVTLKLNSNIAYN